MSRVFRHAGLTALIDRETYASPRPVCPRTSLVPPVPNVKGIPMPETYGSNPGVCALRHAVAPSTSLVPLVLGVEGIPLHETHCSE